MRRLNSLEFIRPAAIPPMPPVSKPKTFRPLCCEYRQVCSEANGTMEGKQCIQCRHNKNIKKKSYFEPI